MLRLLKYYWTHQGRSSQTRRAQCKQQVARQLLTELLEPRMLLTAITSVDPAANSHDATTSTDVAAMFDQPINAAAATPQTFAVHSMQRGQLVGSAVSVITSGTTVSAQPATPFFPGELVQATVTADVRSSGGQPAQPHVWQFRTAATGGTAQFEIGQSLLGHNPQSVAVGDLDGDGDLDAVSSSGERPLTGGGRVWLNNGSSEFSSGGQLPLPAPVEGGSVVLGDVDGDGDLDALLGNPQTSRYLLLNDGAGRFSNSFRTVGDLYTYRISLGDLDGDGDLDVFISNRGGDVSEKVWLNDGNGVFSDSGQRLGDHRSRDVSLGDLDDDGDLDAWIVSEGGNRLWINDGHGNFSDSGQAVGTDWGARTTLGDLDGDGDLDAFETYYRAGSRVWLNSGGAQFSDSGQVLGGGLRSLVGALGDFDGDGDLDAFVVNTESGGAVAGEQIFINDGDARFTDSGKKLGTSSFSTDVSLGDLDGDGDLDGIVRSELELTVWVNQNATPELPSASLSVDVATIVEAGGTATLSATLSAVTTEPVTVELTFAGTATDGADFTPSSTRIVIPAGSSSGTATVTALDDMLNEEAETIVVEIAAVENGTELGAQLQTVTIIDDDEPPMPDVTLTVDNSTIVEAAGIATFSVALSEPTTVPVTIDLGITGSATSSDDFIASSNQLVIAAGTATGELTITAVQDDLDEMDETVIVDIVSVTGGNELGTQQQTITIVDDDLPASFAVTALEATPSGFRVDFAKELDGTEINLYDSQNAGLGATDVVLSGATTGAVAGSLVIGFSSVEFIKTGGPLAPDSYTVTLRSAVDAFKDNSGQLLDGNGDGTGGDDYTNTFVVTERAAGTRTIRVPDFVRGPGQDVNLPADGITGIPITISDGENVRAADVRISYDPALLEITGATAPAGGSVILNTTTTPGVAILVFFSSASLSAGSSTFINLQATVPAGADYGSQQLLDLHSVTVGDGNDNEFPVVVDDALHFTTYFADVSGNGRVNASDAAQVARFAALIDGGFAASLNTDPIVVGDISDNGRINAADASRVAQFAALIPVPEIPPIPGGVVIAGLGVVDLGPGLPVRLTAPPQVEPSTNTTGNQDKENVPGDGAFLVPTGHDAYSAVDALIARLHQSTFDDDNFKFNRALEDAIAELLSSELFKD